MLARFSVFFSQPMGPGWCSPSLFLLVDKHCEGNLKRYPGSRMFQRWLGAVLLHYEQGFKRVKGYASIKQVVAAIEAEQAEGRKLKSAG